MPPLSVLKRTGCDHHFIINIVLTCFGWTPGILHAWYIILRFPDGKRAANMRGGGRRRHSAVAQQEYARRRAEKAPTAMLRIKRLSITTRDTAPPRSVFSIRVLDGFTGERDAIAGQVAQQQVLLLNKQDLFEYNPQLKLLIQQCHKDSWTPHSAFNVDVH
ncbi:hypothetical protein E4T44_00520 [Aureobasidium sp. EXF-8845]|nr:hypothetical protein E4T44_00520 [Aureobasidium sp. EXF-8845]KAI4856837.1 hypothetical protein E4T45_01685 [Aureobasidium sp. EXF-8846]